jgi:putative ABC transport system permease protein
LNVFDVDHWREILHVLTANKVRTTLTVFGVFWGIFMLVVMSGSGNGLENGVMQDFKNTASNSFFMWSMPTSKPYAGFRSGRTFDLTSADVEAVRAQTPEVRVVAPRGQLGGYRGGNSVVRGVKTGTFNINGDVPEILITESIPIASGRFLNPLDLGESRKVAVIGTKVRDVLFDKGEDPIGQAIKIRGVSFQVVGVFKSLHSGERADRETQTIYIPFTTFQQAFHYGQKVDWIAVTVKDEHSALTVEEKVRALLKQRHQVHPDDPRGIGSWNMQEEFQKMQGLFLGIRGLIWIVGIGTLAAGAIGVGNIMLVIVRERTKEIGIRRALGATPWSIASQVVLESVLLTASAGYVGLMAGLWSLAGIRALMAGGEAEFFVNPDVSVASALRALAILVGCGVLAGLMPARRAVRIPPVQALRAT